MAVVAVLLGAIRPITAVSLGAVAAVVLGTLWLSHADVVSRSLEEKDHIAAANVDTRLTTATMAAEMTVASPLVGQGPGGFAASRDEFAPAGSGHVDQQVAHQMYLDVSSELGLPGLAAFLTVVAYGVRGALRARRIPERRPVAHATLIAFSGVLVAACFLSEQFYLPVWLLVALGVALEPASRAGRV
jgi:O-antigen ligase